MNRFHCFLAALLVASSSAPARAAEPVTPLASAGAKTTKRAARPLKAPGKESGVAHAHGAKSQPLVFIAATRETGTAQLTVVSAGGSIAVDGKPVGRSQWSGSLPAGMHRVQVSAPGMRDYDWEIALRDGQDRTLNVKLERASKGWQTAAWIAGGVIVATGIGLGAYFVFKDTDNTREPTIGTPPPRPGF